MVQSLVGIRRCKSSALALLTTRGRYVTIYAVDRVSLAHVALEAIRALQA